MGSTGGGMGKDIRVRVQGSGFGVLGSRFEVLEVLEVLGVLEVRGFSRFSGSRGWGVLEVLGFLVLRF
jgi:hypothetical protein